MTLTQSTPGTEQVLGQPTLGVTSHRVQTTKQMIQPNPSHQRHVARKQPRGFLLRSLETVAMVANSVAKEGDLGRVPLGTKTLLSSV